MHFTPCDCGESHYRLVPRKWWMRAFVGHHRYRCSACHRTMLLRPEGWLPPLGRLLVLLAMLLGTGVGSYWLTGYWEERSDQKWRESVQSGW